MLKKWLYDLGVWVGLLKTPAPFPAPVPSAASACVPQQQGVYPFSDVPFEELGGLVYSPHTDIPFGQEHRFGLAIHTIYERAAQQGYEAGRAAHLKFARDHDGTMSFLDDAQFTEVLDGFMPKGMNEHNAGVWRGYFIAGWVSIGLGFLPEVEALFPNA